MYVILTSALDLKQSFLQLILTLTIFDSICIIFNITIFSGPLLSEHYRLQVSNCVHISSYSSTPPSRCSRTWCRTPCPLPRSPSQGPSTPRWPWLQRDCSLSAGISYTELLTVFSISHLSGPTLLFLTAPVLLSHFSSSSFLLASTSTGFWSTPPM